MAVRKNLVRCDDLTYFSKNFREIVWENRNFQLKSKSKMVVIEFVNEN